MVELNDKSRTINKRKAYMSSLLPLFKWTGGKRREIKHFSPFYPDFVKNEEKYTFVEPFVGAGAVYWSLNNVNGKNIINDFDEDVANFYRQVALQPEEALKKIEELSDLFFMKDVDNHAERELGYYTWRNLDRKGGLANLSPEDRFARFFIVNQLAFSGMRRFNAAGEFNVPFGHYKNFNAAALRSPEHTALLKATDIFTGDYKPVVDANDNDNTFIFIDPPYTRVMKTYSADNEFGEDKQYELRDTLAGLKKAKWMVVIDKSELTSELYKDYIKHTYGLSYGVNIKGRFDTAVEHIVATNY